LIVSVFPVLAVKIAVDNNASAGKSLVPVLVDHQGDKVDDEKANSDSNIVGSSNRALVPVQERIYPSD